MEKEIQGEEEKEEAFTLSGHCGPISTELLLELKARDNWDMGYRIGLT